MGPFHIHWRHGFKTLDELGDLEAFRFRKDDLVVTSRGAGRIRKGYASGEHVQDEIEGAGGGLFMALEADVRKRGDPNCQPGN